jgi:cbb3-type cytochrome oxidase subunit 1
MRPGVEEIEAIAFLDGFLWGVIAGSALRITLGVVLRVIDALSVPVAAMMTANTAIRTPSKMASIQWWIGFCGGVILTIAAVFLKLLASNLP